jgi:hypothetical protein
MVENNQNNDIYRAGGGLNKKKPPCGGFKIF